MKCNGYHHQMQKLAFKIRTPAFSNYTWGLNPPDFKGSNHMKISIIVLFAAHMSNIS
jgi:hypothetical protein